MSLFSAEELGKGWQFKPTEDPSDEAWLPVAKVPTVVHLDLMANNKYGCTTSLYMNFN